MGVFDFLKKIIGKERKKTETGIEETKKEFSLEEIKIKVNERKNEIEEKSEKLMARTKQSITNVIPSLKECLNGLKSANIDERKEDKRLKEMVKGNVNAYLSYFEKLISSLENLENPVFDDYLAQISSMFESFIKNSAKSYQKATILIGKEFEAIQAVLKKFMLEYTAVTKENQENNSKIDKLKKIEEEFEEISDIEKLEEQIKDYVSRLNSEKKLKQEEILRKNSEKEKIIRSSDYKKDLDGKQKVKEEINKLENEIKKLLEKINLKELARKHHSDEKKHRIIQNYIENYKRAIEEDKEKDFERLVKESLGFNANLAEINEKIKSLSNYISQSELKIKKIEEEADSIKKEICEIDRDKEEKERKLEKFENKKEDLIINLKEVYSQIA